jgi:hypothetical protein
MTRILAGSAPIRVFLKIRGSLPCFFDAYPLPRVRPKFGEAR